MRPNVAVMGACPGGCGASRTQPLKCALMLNAVPLSLLRLLCNLRWLGIAGQALTVLLVTGPMQVPLDAAPLWSGIAVLVAFNLYATWRARRETQPSEAELFAHVLVDILVLTWMVGWSGGVENPFSSLFLLPMALCVLALRHAWLWAVALASFGGYAVSALLAEPLPHVHGGITDSFGLHKAGMLANFAVSAGVVLFFFTRMASAWRSSEREVARLRERFTRSEGIIALATHAASVAHELNTPLATLTLLVEDLAEEARTQAERETCATMRALLGVCRDRVRDLARPAHAETEGHRAIIDVEEVIERWRLVRPAIELRRSGSTATLSKMDPAVGHLLQALLNNAADASEQAGSQRVDLHLEARGTGLGAVVRDYGAGFGQSPPVLPATMFRTSKPGGLGIGLALSHATVERLGGRLSMRAAPDGPGTEVSFELPEVAA